MSELSSVFLKKVGDFFKIGVGKPYKIRAEDSEKLYYYKGGYKLISIIDGTKLLIVPEGISVPEDTEDDTVVLQQPVENILVSSTPTTSRVYIIQFCE